jgi:hypothetical protein
VDCPKHNDGDAGVTFIVGNGFTETVTVLVLLQPLALVPVTVYVVVEEGDAETVGPVVPLKPDEGAQLYDVPPDPLSVTDEPTQTAGDEGETLIVGLAFTITVTVAVPEQPDVVPVTV